MRTTALSLALVAFLAVGCSEHAAAPTGPADEAVAPAFTVDKGPPESGVVIRGETSIAAGWTDWDAGIFVFIGIDPRDFCNGVYDFDVVPMKEVHLPRDRGILQLAQGQDVRTTVWPFPGFTGCDLVAMHDPIASGVSDVIYTDNDLYGQGRGNANAFGYRAHGELTRDDGTKAAFSAHVNYVINGSTGFKANSHISLH